jgi:hypothetical protein
MMIGLLRTQPDRLADRRGLFLLLLLLLTGGCTCVPQRNTASATVFSVTLPIAHQSPSTPSHPSQPILVLELPRARGHPTPRDQHPLADPRCSRHKSKGAKLPSSASCWTVVKASSVETASLQSGHKQLTMPSSRPPNKQPCHAAAAPLKCLLALLSATHTTPLSAHLMMAGCVSTWPGQAAPSAAASRRAGLRLHLKAAQRPVIWVVGERVSGE